MTKCQDLPKFQFSGGGVFCNWKVKVPRFLTIFISGGGGILQLKSQSAKISDNFHFRGGGGGILYCRIGVNCRIWTKFSTTPAGSCITDSLSHTTYVETNKVSRIDKMHHPRLSVEPFFWGDMRYTRYEYRVYSPALWRYFNLQTSPTLQSAITYFTPPPLLVLCTFLFTAMLILSESVFTSH